MNGGWQKKRKGSPQGERRNEFIEYFPFFAVLHNLLIFSSSSSTAYALNSE